MPHGAIMEVRGHRGQVLHMPSQAESWQGAGLSPADMRNGTDVKSSITENTFYASI